MEYIIPLIIVVLTGIVIIKKVTSCIVRIIVSIVIVALFIWSLYALHVI